MEQLTLGVQPTRAVIRVPDVGELVAIREMAMIYALDEPVHGYPYRSWRISWSGLIGIVTDIGIEAPEIGARVVGILTGEGLIYCPVGSLKIIEEENEQCHL